MTTPKGTPKDAQVMTSILKDMGIMEYEARVVNQMLEFTYRYITNILDDARIFSTHAKKKNLDVDDVKLAIQMQMDKSFTTPPPRDILIDISRQRNNTPLPLIKPHCGPRLPPDRYCLSSCNYHLKSTKKPRQLGSQFGSLTNPKMNLSSAQSGGKFLSAASKVSPAVNLTTKSGATLSLMGKGTNAPTVTIVTRPGSTITTPTTTPTIKTESGVPPTPIIKLTSGSANNAPSNSTVSAPLTLPTAPSKVPAIITRTVVAPTKPVQEAASSTEPSLKRKREDDDYDAE